MLTTDTRSIKTDYLYTFRFVFSLLHKLNWSQLCGENIWQVVLLVYHINNRGNILRVNYIIER